MPQPAVTGNDHPRSTVRPVSGGGGRSSAPPRNAILEIGGAPGTAAKAVARRIGNGHIVVIDRSAKGIALIEQNASAEIAAGLLSVRHVAAEYFELLAGEPPFDLAFAIRVGALDGRHPEAGVRARARIAAALSATAQLFIDGGDPLQTVNLREPGQQ